MRVLLPAMLGVLILAALGQVCAQDAAATVNGEKISQEAFLATLKARFGGPVLDALIGSTIIRQAAKAAGITVTAEELKAQFDKIEKKIDSSAPVTGINFDMWLMKAAHTRESYLNTLYDQELMQKMVEKQVKVTDEDVANFYQRHQEELKEPARVQIAHILVKDEAQAKSILGEIRSGKITWADAVAKYTLHAPTKNDGGDMGFITEGDSPMQKAAFGLKQDGDMSEPVQSRMGFHILKRMGFRLERVPKFEDIQVSLRNRLEFNQLMALVDAKRGEIMKAAKVEVLEKLAPEPTPMGVQVRPQP